MAIIIIIARRLPMEVVSSLFLTAGPASIATAIILLVALSGFLLGSLAAHWLMTTFFL
jgi:uncharacterized membrane protein YqaE (UPF0057 family)